MAQTQDSMDTTDGVLDTLTDKIVGKDCTINSIMIKLKPAEDSLDKEWKELAKHLNTPKISVTRNDKDMLLDKKKIMEVVEDLILEWKMRQASNATLKTLIGHCKNVGLEDAYEILTTLLDELQDNVLR